MARFKLYLGSQVAAPAGDQDGALAATGTGTTLFVGASNAEAIAEATGTGTALFVGAAESSAVLTDTGTATVDFVGFGPSEAAALEATGTGTASFVGASEGGEVVGSSDDFVVRGSAYWKNYNKPLQVKKRKKLNELDELVIALRAKIVPWTAAKAYAEEQALYRESVERSKVLDENDTLDRIELEIANIKNLLAEIDEEESLLLLL
jgi:hypothetical protein